MLTEQETGYKVALPTGPRAASFKPATDLALQSIRYRIGQTTEPTDSGPCGIFPTLERAREWANDSRAVPAGAVVLEVQYSPSTQKTLWKRQPPTFVRNSYGRGYHPESNGITEKPLSTCPAGTILADAVTPIRVITD